jgi:diguanylate cyclase (GGDEF)-like protein/PAS domain S-box-containing protein
MLDSVDFYREILDNLYDGIFFINTEGLITYWNNGAASLTGYQSNDVIKRDYCEVFKPLDLHGNELFTYCGCPVRNVMNESTLSEVEGYIRHKEGHLVPISARIAPVRKVDRQYVIAVEIYDCASPRFAMRQKLEELEEMAMFDPLTDLANRRFLKMSLETRLEELKRYGRPFAVMFIDIDHFKRINDTYGHQVGDRMLKMISSTMVNTLRSFDVIGRWGGEEFLALLINIKEEDLFPVVDRFRRLVENSVMTLDDGSQLNVTVSIGATIVHPGETAEQVVKRADQLMFESKRGGRNMVSVGYA